jgi:V-type H+-transporting ATPase subunit E
MNQFRLDKLKARIECVEQVFSETKNQLISRIRSKPEDYKNVLTNLLIQGFIKLLEENVNVICKKDELEIVKSIVEPAKEKFLAMLKKDSKKHKNFKLTVTVDTKYFLPQEM